MITGMYELMEEFNVQAPPQDLALFQTLGPAVVQCRNAIDKSVSERDTNVTKLATLIDKDIEELEKEVKSIKQDVQDGSILDINTDQEKIKVGFQNDHNESVKRRTLYEFPKRDDSYIPRVMDCFQPEGILPPLVSIDTVLKTIVRELLND